MKIKTQHSNTWDAAKVIPRGKFIALKQLYLFKERKISN